MKRICKTIITSLFITTLSTPAFCNPVDTSVLASKCQSKECPTDQTMDPWKAVGLNLLPFGFGSYQQGDMVGGAIITTVDAISLATILYPFVDQSLFQGGGWGALMAIVYGGTGYAVGRVIGVSSPWIYQAQQHKKVSELDPLHPKTNLAMDVQFFNYQASF